MTMLQKVLTSNQFEHSILIILMVQTQLFSDLCLVKFFNTLQKLKVGPQVENLLTSIN